MLASEDLTDRDPLDLIAEDFAERCRRGERPSVEDYVSRYPEHAQELRELLPTVDFLERGRADLTRPRTVETTHSDPIRFGEHRVIRELGRGGMGIVYEAIQEPLGRRVAVKVLPRPSAADPRSRERFLREAKAIALLNHRNIVAIHQVGEWENVPYFVMELIEGMGLDHPPAGPKGGLPRAKWVAGLGIQAAEALAHAHGQGMLHRDVKPANLLLEPSGHLRLTDFGLAKLADDLSLTDTGGLPGTLRYLAPECLDADGDARSDLYGLGLTLYEVLLGRPAFTESNRVRLLQQVRDAEPAAPRSIASDVPLDLETILLKTTARDPNGRYASAAELADDLRRFIEGRPILARRIKAGERLARLVKRNPLVSALTTATVSFGMISLVFVGLYVTAPPMPDEFGNADPRAFDAAKTGRPDPEKGRFPRNEAGREGKGQAFRPPPPPGPEEFPDGESTKKRRNSDLKKAKRGDGPPPPDASPDRPQRKARDRG